MRITKKDGQLFCKPQLPASKSISTRILILQSLYPDLISVDQISPAGDVQLLQQNLQQIRTCSASGIPYIIYAKNSGAVMRFLTAYAAMSKGQYLVTGEPRLLERPVAELVNSLRQMNAEIEYAGKEGYCPLRITGKPLQGGAIEIDPAKSSQFVTALLLLANEMENGLQLKLNKKPSSEKYILLTIDILQKAGIKVTYRRNVIRVKKSTVKPVNYEIEGDWAAASFWYLMMMLSNEGKVSFTRLNRNSKLPEAVLPELFDNAGVETSFMGTEVKLTKKEVEEKAIEYDFTHNPDLALPFITGIALKGKEAEFSGLENLRFKESDRLAALLEILDQLSVKYQFNGNGNLRLKAGKAILRPKTNFDGKNDHRLIMTLAALSLHFKTEIKIRNYSGVEKSYPQFWLDIRRAGFNIKKTAR